MEALLSASSLSPLISSLSSSSSSSSDPSRVLEELEKSPEYGELMREVEERARVIVEEGGEEGPQQAEGASNPPASQTFSLFSSLSASLSSPYIPVSSVLSQPTPLSQLTVLSTLDPADVAGSHHWPSLLPLLSSHLPPSSLHISLSLGIAAALFPAVAPMQAMDVLLAVLEAVEAHQVGRRWEYGEEEGVVMGGGGEFEE